MFDYYSQIDDYVNDKLSLSQRKDFEKALNEDPSLKAVFEERSIYGFIADGIIDNDISKRIRKRQDLNSKHGMLRKKLLLILSVALIFLSAYLIYISYSESYSEKVNLYAEYYSPYTDSLRGASSNGDSIGSSPCDMGHKAMDVENYDLAKSYFVTGLDSGDKSCEEKALFHLALIELRISNYDSAITFLKRIIAMSDYGYRHDAVRLLEDINQL